MTKWTQTDIGLIGKNRRTRVWERETHTDDLVQYGCDILYFIAILGIVSADPDHPTNPILDGEITEFVNRLISSIPGLESNAESLRDRRITMRAGL